MPSEFPPNGTDSDDSRGESAEKYGEKPSESQVIDAFSERRAKLREKVDEIKGREGFKLDATGVMDKRQELRDAENELNEFETKWRKAGGDKIDEAEESRSNLNFQSSAEDHIHANTQLRDAKTAFYRTFLREQAKQNEPESDTPKNESSQNDAQPAPAKTPDDEPKQLADDGEGTPVGHTNPVDAKEPPAKETGSSEKSSDEDVNSVFGGEHDNDDPCDIGNEVTVRRSDGTIEHHWVVQEVNGDKVKVGSKNEQGQPIHKWVGRDELEELNKEAEEENPVDSTNNHIKNVYWVEQRHARAKEEYDALSDAEKESEKGKKLKETIDATQKFIDDANETRQTAEEDEETKKRAEKRTELFNDVKSTVMEQYREEYDAKINELAEIQGKLTTKRMGRRKNQERAKALESEIAHLNKHIARDFIKAGKEVGLYNIEGNDPEAVKKQMIQRKQDDALKLAMQSSQDLWSKTSEKLQNRQENLNIFQKFMQKAGGWMNKGNKRNYLTGFGTGLLTGSVPMAIGATIPIGSAIAIGVGTGAKAFTYFSAREANIAEAVKNRSESLNVENDPALQELREQINAKTEKSLKDGKTIDDKKEAGRIAEYTTAMLFGDQRDENIKTNEKQITGRARKTMGRFAIGFAVGALLGGATGHLVHDQFLTSSGGNSVSGQAPNHGGGDSSYSDKDFVRSYVNGHPPVDAVQINTNGAPEHAFHNILGQFGTEGKHMSFSDVYKATNGHVFQTADGSPVPMKDFGGNIGLGYVDWDQTMNVQLTTAAKDALGLAA